MQKCQHFHFLNPRIVFSALILSNWENPPLPSDIKPPLVATTVRQKWQSLTQKQAALKELGGAKAAG